MSRSDDHPDLAALEPAAQGQEAIDLRIVDEIVRRHGGEPGAAIPILQDIQSRYRYLPEAALRRVCALTEISPVQIQGISTFYAQFRHMPMGRHLISVCHGTACHVAGAQRISDALARHLGLSDGADTDARRLFTLQKVACLGCCSLAPVMSVDGEIYGHLTAGTVAAALDGFLRSRADAGRRRRRPALAAADRPAPEFRVSLVSCCVANGTLAVREALERELAHLGRPVRLRCSGCVGLCDIVPLVDYIAPDGILTRYTNVDPASVRGIVRRHVAPRGLLRRVESGYRHVVRALWDGSAWDRPEDHREALRADEIVAFTAKQTQIVMEGTDRLDPLDIDEYIARGGFRALEHCLAHRTRGEVIDGIDRAGLRGRGGGGFPTGRKWRTVAEQPGPVRYVVMNGDEGDPGAFMDRTLLEAVPYRVLEGIAIAAYAVGAEEGYLYVRNEYPRATESIRLAIENACERGYLGDRMPGGQFRLRLHVREGAGAFVCGEETGLLASLEGRRGTPRCRPPYPSEQGLWGRPTCINNVETYANVPWIMLHGPEEFRRIGTERSRGTKVFALAGAVRRGGLIEVPMGITIDEIVREIGGGVPEGHEFKAVQVGGPSGGCLPAAMGDTPVDYEELTDKGAMMGSGGIVVLDETACMVDVARFFLRFTQSESCGKCTFCRVGTRRMLEILDRLCECRGAASDLDELEALGRQVAAASLCGLGQTAPNPVLTTLRYFRSEYEAHVEGRCPAHKCPDLIRFEIGDRCIGCTLCAQNCPAEAIPIRPYERHEIDQEKCVRCGSCRRICPADAVGVE